ncbi:hypothetical protein HELRODRAFT_164182 [Helobdella robusta]|uniref:Uncharacterized protein n=1 Tax=Helobdella robusta TaxID=6412 RepID=T1EV21_HELRO|nr:hypothetical protein HELRODRAFT_164182 [Helobdella robusta]ESN94353.1 hypothetical protein HELRODRAFT_164182 [Helobdella robusta]
MNFENRWVLRSALNFASDREVVREVGREFQRKGQEKAKVDVAKECLTRVKKKREQEDDRKPGHLGSINISDKYLGNNLDRDLYMKVQILKIIRETSRVLESERLSLRHIESDQAIIEERHRDRL